VSDQTRGGVLLELHRAAHEAVFVFWLAGLAVKHRIEFAARLGRDTGFGEGFGTRSRLYYLTVYYGKSY